MAKEISTSIHISASKEQIWSVFSNFENYPNWNPFIKALSGDMKVGSKLKAKLIPPGKKGMEFKPTVIECETDRVFSWQGHLIIPGLFDGLHRFEIIELPDGTCQFIQSEKFSGMLIPFFKNMLEQNTREGFEQMNAKLKEICENDLKA